MDVLEASPMPNIALGHVNGIELDVLIDVEVCVIIKCDAHIIPCDRGFVDSVGKAAHPRM